MGVCELKSKKTQVVTKEDQKLDFETYREAVMKDNEESTNKVIEVIANITEIIKHNNESETQTLLSKYLFINPNGKFKTVVGSRFGNLNFEGTIQKTGLFYLTYKKERNVIEDGAFSKIFEGQIVVNGNTIQITGNIDEESSNGRVRKNDTFIVDFTQEYWILEYLYKSKPVAINLFMKQENGNFHGLGFDERGFSLINGRRNSNKVSLSQIYIHRDDGELEKNTFVFKGELINNNTQITGIVSNKDINEVTKFSLAKQNVKN